MINIGELQMINIVEPQLERGDAQFSEEIETANPRPDDRLPHPRRRSRSFRSRTLTAGLNLCRNSASGDQFRSSWNQRVAGSNPAAPTINQCLTGRSAKSSNNYPHSVRKSASELTAPYPLFARERRSQTSQVGNKC
jgi:hypothetical protein